MAGAVKKLERTDRLFFGELRAEATLPAGEVLLSRLLSLGGGVRVLEPASLAEALRARAEQIAALYGGKQPLR